MANAIPPAETLIRSQLSGGRRLSWEKVMQIALYEPGVGYYRKGARAIGKTGDFFTSVSVGPVFGELLALFCIAVWRSLGCPAEFAIIEQGAHDGRLAEDVLRGLEKHVPELAQRVRYHLIEPDTGLCQAQRARLACWQDRVSQGDDWHLPIGLPSRAVFLCNELVDAFPVHRVVFDAESAEWREMQVEEHEGELVFAPADPENPALREELNRLPREAPDGFTTEINLGMLEWLRAVAKAPFEGAILILDYGYTTEEWQESANPKGTLCRYKGHQTDDRMLEDLGECDLTSHVNFTRLAETAEALHMPVHDFKEQGRFLSHLAAERLRSGPAPDANWLRQFQTLSHPGMMGRSFHALALSKGAAMAEASDQEKRVASLRRLGL